MTKYRSKLEERISKFLPGAEYEPWKIDYIVPHTYTPDFVKDNKVYEVKGFFRGQDTMKYVAIHKELAKQGKTFIFVLSHPNRPVRKGTKLSMSKWCDKNNIEWVSY